MGEDSKACESSWRLQGQKSERSDLEGVPADPEASSAAAALGEIAPPAAREEQLHGRSQTHRSTTDLSEVSGATWTQESHQTRAEEREQPPRQLL